MNNLGKKVMNVAFCYDDNYLMPASIMIESLLIHSTDCHVVVYTFSDDLSESSKVALKELIDNYDAELHFLRMPLHAKELLKNASLAFEYLSVTAYYRLLLPYVLDNNVDRLLYLDCDVLVRKNPYRFYKAIKADKYILGVEDIEKKRHCERLNLSQYVNSGVLVLNLNSIRKDFPYDLMLCKMKELIAIPGLLGDQDMINILYQDGIMIAPDRYNYQHVIHKKYILTHMKELREAVIIHFITEDKPWKGSYLFPFSLEYYHYLRKYQDFLMNLKWWTQKPLGVINIVKKRKRWEKSKDN